MCRLTWMQKAGCAAALAGVLALAVYDPEPADSDGAVCAALQVFAALALHDRVPPPDATPDTAAFVAQMNTDLAHLRAQIKEACHRR